MGDRLVQRLSYNGKFLAASYNHWAASDWEKFEEILDDVCCKNGLFDDPGDNATPENAVRCLFEAINKYWNNPKITCGFHEPLWQLQDKKDYKVWNTYYSKPQEEIIAKMPDIPISHDHSDGFITVDKEIADGWMRWAEAFNDFDFRS